MDLFKDNFLVAVHIQKGKQTQTLNITTFYLMIMGKLIMYFEVKQKICNNNFHNKN
jgi:hypothetical protein